ncbi:MAG TPA: NADH-quinone oxidoreductase subunit NuoH [Anaerolineales bacterium]
MIDLLEWTLESFGIITIVLGGFAYLTLFERRLMARFQTRIGPNRTGPQGLLQPIADGVKLLFKEELIPDQADKLLFVLAPVITVVPVLLLLAVIPFGPDLIILGRRVSQGLAPEVDVGALYILAIASIAVYGIVIAGWASNSKYALLGGIRSSAQMVSYELALGLAFIGPILLADSLNMAEIVRAQRGIWFVLLQPIGFLIFLTASIAELNRAPFDMPEAEQELTAGYHTEYSGMKFALFFMAEYGKMIAVSFIAVTLFLGGYWGPFVDRLPILGPLYLFAKVVGLLFLMIWLRATLPRLRYDRLMAFGWKVLLPLGLLNVLVTGGLIVAFG